MAARISRPPPRKRSVPSKPRSPFELKPMSIADFDDVLLLWERTEGIGLNESDSKPNLVGFLERNPGMSFVARKGQALIGAVLCGHDGRRGYLHHLAVAQQHRGHGLGKKLVESCLAELNSAGILKCNIFIYENNFSGEAFWKHHGWIKRADLRVMQKPTNQ